MTAVTIILLTALAVGIVAFAVVHSGNHDREEWEEFNKWHDRYHRDLNQ